MALRDLGIAVRVLCEVRSLRDCSDHHRMGLGASAAIFSVRTPCSCSRCLYKDPERLVLAGMELRQRHVKDLQFSNADFIDFAKGQSRCSRTLAASSPFAG